MGAAMSAIGALWLRQIKRYWRSRARMIGSLGQPLLFLFVLGFGLNPLYQQQGGGDYIEFLAPGIIAMAMLFTAVFSGIEIIWDKQFGFLKETLVAPVSRIDIMIGRTLGGATVALIQGGVVLLITLLAGFRPDPLMLPVALAFMFLIALLFTAVGTAIASVLDDMQAFPLIINFLIMPLFFLSGALFPLEHAPVALRVLSYLDPLSYGVDGMRAAMTGIVHFGFLIDAAVLGAVSALALVIGGYLFSRIQL